MDISQAYHLIDQGDDLLDQDKFSDAIEKYQCALDIVPSPIDSHGIATEILSAIGDAYFQAGDYPSALAPFQNAVFCPNGLGNAFIHLRLGQVRFELGQFEEAADELTRAYMADGKTVFEDEDPKYLEFLKTKIVID